MAAKAEKKGEEGRQPAGRGLPALGEWGVGASRDRGRCPVQQELRDRHTHISGLQATASSSSPNPSIQPLAGHLHGETGLTRTHRTPQVIASPLWPLAERFQPPGPGHPFIHGSLQGASCLIPPPTSLAGPLELLTSPSPIHGAPSSPPLLSGTHYAQSRDHPRSLVGVTSHTPHHFHGSIFALDESRLLTSGAGGSCIFQTPLKLSQPHD